MTEKKALNIVTPDGVVKIGVKVVGGDIMALAGKYSLSFVREMAAQLTPVIESAVSVSGLAESGLSLQIVFAPNTFMEHISDNVTYRRLLLLDGVSAPRDFWVKWTRLDGAVAYSVKDNVSADNILYSVINLIHCFFFFHHRLHRWTQIILLIFICENLCNLW